MDPHAIQDYCHLARARATFARLEPRRLATSIPQRLSFENRVMRANSVEQFSRIEGGAAIRSRTGTRQEMVSDRYRGLALRLRTAVSKELRTPVPSRYSREDVRQKAKELGWSSLFLGQRGPESPTDLPPDTYGPGSHPGSCALGFLCD